MDCWDDRNGWPGNFKTIKKKYNFKLLNSKHLDLRRQIDVEAWMKKINQILFFLLQQKVGGIFANDKYPVEFIEDNLLIFLM